MIFDVDQDPPFGDSDPEDGFDAGDPPSQRAEVLRLVILDLHHVYDRRAPLDDRYRARHAWAQWILGRLLELRGDQVDVELLVHLRTELELVAP